MSTEPEAVVNQLTLFGSKIGEFNQMKRREKSRIAGEQIDEGFCRGVCIDWTRRVLQGGKPSFSIAKEKMRGPTLRQGTIQINLENCQMLKKAVIEVRNQLARLYNATATSGEGNDYVEIPEPLFVQMSNYLTVTRSANGKYKMAAVKRCTGVLDELAETYDHETEAGWKAFAHMMDEYHLQKRKERLRDEESGKDPRMFSHIKILESTRYRGFPVDLHSAVEALLKLPKFVAGTVMILGFELVVDNKDTGHAVAVNKRNNGTFYFFDPNFGVFDYDEQGLLEALRYLFTEEPGEPIYGEDNDVVTGRACYTLFGHADLTV